MEQSKNANAASADAGNTSATYSINKTNQQQSTTPIVNLNTLINSILLSSIQVTNFQLLKFSIALLGFLIILLHILPVSIILIVLLILFIIFVLIYVIIYGYKFSIANKPINSAKLNNFRDELKNRNW